VTNGTGELPTPPLIHTTNPGPALTPFRALALRSAYPGHMPMTSEELYQARTWIPWASVTDAELNTRFDALGDFWALVQEQLRRQLMIALSTPAQFTVVGEYGQNIGQNIDGIRQAMKDAEQEALAGEGGVSTASLVRAAPYPAGRTSGCITIAGSGTRLL
jgi:hypothetical protein